MKSIRRFLLATLLGVCSVLLALAGFFSYRAGLQEAGEMFDARLVQSARVLVSLVDEPIADLADHPGEPIVIRGWHGRADGVGDALAFRDGHAYETKLAFQVLDGQGRILLRSDSAPLTQLAPLRAGFSDIALADGTWRVFALRSDGDRWFQSAERADIRAEVAEDIAMGTLLPLLLAFPLIALLVCLVVNWLSRSLSRVSDEVGQRDPWRMQPLQLEALPREMRGMVTAINSLLARLHSGLERERRFVADAAHEMRTPIAALKVHAQNLRGADSGDERGHSQDQLEASVERIGRLIDQLIALSRVEQSAPRAQARRLDFDALIRGEVDDAAALASAKRIDLRSRLGAGCECIGDERELQVLMRNLLENAVRYTPPGGRIQVSSVAMDDAVSLTVEDSGPGIPEYARDRVFDRFHRELGTGVDGSGLGLAIVREIASRHGALVVLERSEELGGLRVRVRVPLDLDICANA